MKNKKRIIRHEQWIEVHRINGKTVTSYHPPNEEFEQLRLEADPPPDFIYRRINFFQGVPPEYMWCKPPLRVEMYGGQFLQRVTLDEWPTILAAEQNSTHGHVISAKRPAARPEDLGPCPCEHCTYERENNLPSRFDGQDR